MAKAQQQVVITIGHQSILLPDDTSASTIIKALSRGMPCYSMLGCGAHSKVQILKGEMEVSMSYVPNSAKIVDDNDQPVNLNPPKEKKGRLLELKQPGFLALTEGSRRL